MNNNVLDEMARGTRQYHMTIKKIIEPIEQYYGINNIIYIEITNDGRLINLMSHNRWMEHCLEKQYFIDDPHMVVPDNMGTGFAIWSTRWSHYYQNEEYQKGLYQDCRNFDLCNGLTYAQRSAEGYRLYIFCAPQDNIHLNSKILSSIEHIKQFIDYFDSAIAPIRKNLEDHRIDFASLKGEAYHHQRGIIEVKSDDKLKKYRFFKQLGLIDDNLEQLALTDREKQCIRLYLEGRSATSTAKALHISPRTVESHMEKIKLKLNVDYKRDIFDKAKILEFMEII